ncbi:MAG: DUF411 domain-containing protein [Alphaproteobacteria bacterium]|nr:DUF411 domain-containing protein [Alphaproteobacteria bacterium]
MKAISKSALALLFAIALIGSTAFADSGKTMTIWKNPGCMCCDGYAEYLERNGFKVTVKATHDLSAMGRAAGIPEDFQGCHLGMIDGYVVSGHVPVATVNKLLTERPSIKGVTLPGMPAGSPGMSGQKDSPWEIYAVDDGRSPEIYNVE